jgi:chemotaxis regulatin CheY-phosphate phosphatase CheZ
MNKHIELVKKWLADKDSVSLKELEANSNAAKAVYYYTDANDSAYYVAHAAAYAADCASYYAEDAVYWVKRFEELTK